MIYFFLFIICFSCSSEDVIQNKEQGNSRINILKFKILNFKSENNPYAFGLIENNSCDTICFFKILDQLNCQIDSFQYNNGNYSWECINSEISPQKFDLFLLKPYERHWFYLGDLLGRKATEMKSARIVVFWADYSDTSWNKTNDFIKASKFRVKVNDIQGVDFLPSVKGFEDYSIP